MLTAAEKKCLAQGLAPGLILINTRFLVFSFCLIEDILKQANAYEFAIYIYEKSYVVVCAHAISRRLMLEFMLLHCEYSFSPPSLSKFVKPHVVRIRHMPEC